MFFKLNNKLLKIKSYNHFRQVINLLSSSEKYILINSRHSSLINEERFYKLPDINEIVINYKVNGGFLESVVEALIGIYKFFLLIPKLLIWFIQFIIWLIRFSVFIMRTIYYLFKNGFTELIKNLMRILITEPFALIGRLFKKIFGSGEKTTDEKLEDKKYRCFRPKDDGTLPTTVLISTLLCPPLGVFMVYGLTGWKYILMSGLLSLFYYFPGLIYTMVLFYN